MIQTIFEFLSSMEDTLWAYIGFPTILLFGIALTIGSRAMQIRKFPEIVREFLGYIRGSKSKSSLPNDGLKPLKAFFASIGGCLGIGNVVGVATAIQIGGPGALFWIWITAILGSLVKYAEVYIGIKHKRTAPDGSHKGGPMFFLHDAFQSRIPSVLFCILLCLYGVEIYQFNIVATVTADAFHCQKIWTILLLLILVFWAAKGGLKRVSTVASVLVPFFISLYLLMGLWVIANYAAEIPHLLYDIFVSAWSPHAAEGGFVGSSLLLTLSQGVRRGCYSSDIGIGYASIIHSESTNSSPMKQARLLIFEVFMDTFLVCTLSAVLVLITGVWTSGLEPFKLVGTALSTHFPHMEYFMPFLLTLLGYSVVLTYLSAGTKTALFLSPERGKKIYFFYALGAFLFFSLQESRFAMCVMSFINLFLLFLNSLGLWKLKKEIVFDEPQPEPVYENA